MQIEAAGRTDIGKKRPVNEDQLFVGRQLFAVADGVGGHQAGDVASDLVIQHLAPLDTTEFDSLEAAREALVAAINTANDAIYSAAQANPDHHGMATTVTAALMYGNAAAVAQVGDTRAYVSRRGGAVEQVTAEHSFVSALVEAGVITEEDALTHPQRSLILRAVGSEAELDVDADVTVLLRPRDQLVIVSDGVHGVISDEHLSSLLTNPSVDDAVNTVIRDVRSAGAPDNVTVVIVRVER